MATGNDGQALAALGDQLSELQLSQLVHARRALILFEGAEGSGKKHALRQLAAAFDPCCYTVHHIAYDRREAAEGHWLARFWRMLPPAGHTSVFFGSWYRRVLDDRILGRTDESSVPRSFDEINEFEAQQRDYGTLIVKLYFDVSSEVQDRRLAEREQSPWLNLVRREPPVSVGDAAYARAVDDLKRYSDTRWSPWRIIDGNDESAAALAALGAITDAWAKAMPAEPPRVVGASGRAA